MLYVTGDKHGSYEAVTDFCAKAKTTAADALIVLGDCGVNYRGPAKDRRLKHRLAALAIFQGKCYNGSR